MILGSALEREREREEEREGGQRKGGRPDGGRPEGGREAGSDRGMEGGGSGGVCECTAGIMHFFQ